MWPFASLRRAVARAAAIERHRARDPRVIIAAMTAALWTRVLEAVPAEARGELATRIAADLAAARARWPGAAIDDASLAAAIGDRLAGQRDAAAAVTRLRVDDFLLAQWCATGDPRAIAAFEAVYRDDFETVFARFRRLPLSPDELRQALRIKLFVAARGRAPRIGDYSGFGFLQNWLRVTALRVMVDIARGEKARRLEEVLADDDLLGPVAPGSDLAGRYTRAELSHAVKQAFARAVAGLPPRQRNFLRHAHVDSLTLDQIAALYTIHRATVARTLAQARADLMGATRRALGERLGVGDDELDSMVRAADSRIDLSLSRVLAKDPASPAEDNES